MIDSEVLATIELLFFFNLLASIGIMCIGYKCLCRSYEASGGFLFLVAFLVLLFGGYTFDTKLVECPECHTKFTKDNIKPVIQSITENKSSNE